MLWVLTVKCVLNASECLDCYYFTTTSHSITTRTKFCNKVLSCVILKWCNNIFCNNGFHNFFKNFLNNFLWSSVISPLKKHWHYFCHIIVLMTQWERTISMPMDDFVLNHSSNELSSSIGRMNSILMENCVHGRSFVSVPYLTDELADRCCDCQFVNWVFHFKMM